LGFYCPELRLAGVVLILGGLLHYRRSQRFSSSSILHYTGVPQKRLKLLSKETYTTSGRLRITIRISRTDAEVLLRPVHHSDKSSSFFGLIYFFIGSHLTPERTSETLRTDARVCPPSGYVLLLRDCSWSEP
jgi:hypothetical protein